MVHGWGRPLEKETDGINRHNVSNVALPFLLGPSSFNTSRLVALRDTINRQKPTRDEENILPHARLLLC
jgi:hypothetical protein